MKTPDKTEKPQI